MGSKLFHLQPSDFKNAFVMAVLGGAFLPIAIVIQTPGFSVATANWWGILIVALNGAIVAFVGYLAKNVFSDQQGKVFGKF